MFDTSIRKRLGSVMAAGLMLCAAAPAKASLLGVEVSSFFQVTAFGPDFNVWTFLAGGDESLPVTATVGSAPEFGFSGASSLILADLDANSLEIGIFGGDGVDLGSDLTFDFLGLNWGSVAGKIIGLNVTQNEFSGVTFGFTADSINVIIPDQILSGNALEVTFEIVVEHAIPEPGTMAILGIGLLGLGLARRRRAA